MSKWEKKNVKPLDRAEEVGKEVGKGGGGVKNEQFH